MLPRGSSNFIGLIIVQALTCSFVDMKLPHIENFLLCHNFLMCSTLFSFCLCLVLKFEIDFFGL